MQVTSNREHLQIGMVHCNLRTKIPFPNMLATRSSNYLMSQNTIGRSWHAALQYGINPWRQQPVTGPFENRQKWLFLSRSCTGLAWAFCFLVKNQPISSFQYYWRARENVTLQQTAISPLRKQHRSIWVPGTDSNGHRGFHLHCRRRLLNLFLLLTTRTICLTHYSKMSVNGWFIFVVGISFNHCVIFW